MQNLLNFPKQERGELFNQTALKMGMGLPTVVEKDFWVVKVLNLLFSDQSFKKHHVFKGGTSLSKCFGLIQRFSEDIDLTISKEFLGFHESLEMIWELGDKKRKKYFEALDEAATSHVSKIADQLRAKLDDQEIGTDCRLYVDAENPQNIIFEYPRSLSLSIYPEDAYVKPKILLEFGCRGEMGPANLVKIRTYAEEAFDNLFLPNDVVVNALNPERTFWEKITLLHMLAHQDNSKSLQNRELLSNVVYSIRRRSCCFPQLVFPHL